MRAIELTQGHKALVDDEDYGWLTEMGPWHAAKDCYTFYARRNVPRPDGRQATVYMHRVVLGLVAGDGIEVDHWNGNGLDNRRANLRQASHAENQHNRRSLANASGVTGVWWNPRIGRWQVYIAANGRRHYLGSFADIEDAAAAHAAASINYHGAFARVNDQKVNS